MSDRVLITGASGFIGRYIAARWKASGADVVALNRRPLGETATVVCDLSLEIPELAGMRFSAVIHCAGKVHSVPRTQAEAKEFFRVNVDGTKNLLRGLDSSAGSPRKFILISTVSVYGRDQGSDIGESHPLSGTSPYAASRIEAEHLIAEWAVENKVELYIFRLPLVVGTFPPGNLGKMVASIQRGTYPAIRGNKSRKSVVLAEDVADLTWRVDRASGVYNLTDGRNPRFSDIEAAIAEAFGKKIKLQIPLRLLRTICRLGDFSKLPVNSDLLSKLTSTLTFSTDAARNRLGWDPRSVIEFIRRGGLTNDRQPASD
jgi:GlcNAc-P-P-Und epimerase